jgi:uncharacterized Zn finger protein
MSKCPKCDHSVSTLQLTAHKGMHGGISYPCITFDCPACGSILSASIDPYALRDEIANEVKKKLGR